MAEHELEWDDLRTFLMIARHQTLSGAARALGVAQPTMGRRLEALELRAGAKLLLRTPGGFVLTKAGEAVMGNVERIEQEALSVQRQIAGADVRLEGCVRLTAVETLATRILISIIAGFRRDHPAVQVDLVVAPRTLSLTHREADIALRMAAFAPSDLIVRRVAYVAYGLYASPEYMDRKGMDFAGDHDLILTEADLLGTPEMRYLRACLPGGRPALCSNSRFLQTAAAREGIGIACLARYLGDADPGLRRVAPPDSLGAPAPREVWLGVHADLRHMPRIRVFMDALRHGLAKAAPILNPLEPGQIAGPIEPV